PDEAFAALLTAAEDGAADTDGIVVFNNISGEPITGLEQGRPLLVRAPDSELRLGSIMRAHVYSLFATLAIGLDVLAEEGVGLELLDSAGGRSSTSGVARRFHAATPVTPHRVPTMAHTHLAVRGWAALYAYSLLAAYLYHSQKPLARCLDEEICSGTWTHSVTPTPKDAAGFRAFLDRYRKALAVEAAAVDPLP